MLMMIVVDGWIGLELQFDVMLVDDWRRKKPKMKFNFFAIRIDSQWLGLGDDEQTNETLLMTAMRCIFEDDDGRWWTKQAHQN